MEEGAWTKVVNKKKLKNEERKKNILYWNNLKERYPYIVTPSRAHRIKTKLNIDKLDNMLLSKECIEYQCSGWKYEKVVRSGNNDNNLLTNTEDKIYSILPVNNEWGDIALFSKKKFTNTKEDIFLTSTEWGNIVLFSKKNNQVMICK